MKDIDFDELDRAVNSLIGPRQQGAATQIDTPSAAPVSVLSATPVSEIATDDTKAASVADSNQTPMEKPVAMQVANQSQEQSVQKPVPIYYSARPRPLITTPINPPKPAPINTFESLASKRSSGRFVDVVNPSANVQMSSKVEPVTAPTPITQPSIMMTQPQPVMAAQPQTNAPELQSQPAMQNNPMAVNQNPVQTATMNSIQPQTLSQAATQTVLQPAPVAVVDNTIDEDDDIEQISNFINSAMSSNQNPVKAQDSPFVTDSKVDKRPLGAVIASPIAQQGAPMPQLPISNFNATSTQLPPELQNDLLSIESDTMPEVTAAKAVEIPAVDYQAPMMPQAMPFSTPAVDYQQTPQAAIQPAPGMIPQQFSGTPISIAPIVSPTQAAMTVQAPVVSQMPAQAPIQTSIPQQYPERPNVVDHTTTPIYDANAYHKLNSKDSKKSPLMWLFWMLGLVVVGAGVGVVAYFFILPNL